jgi:hypothetical protein
VTESIPPVAAAGVAGVGQWSMELATGTKRWDDRTRALFGLGPDEPVPDRAQWRARFLWPADAEESERRIAESLRTGEPYEMEYRIRRPDGTVRWLFTRAVFNPEDAGEVLGVTMDITELKEQGAEAGRTRPLHRGTDLARLSHELRTPLNAVIGFAQLLEVDSRPPLTAAQRERARAIQTAAWTLLSRIEALLEPEDAAARPRTAATPPEPVDPD